MHNETIYRFTNSYYNKWELNSEKQGTYCVSMFNITQYYTIRIEKVYIYNANGAL